MTMRPTKPTLVLNQRLMDMLTMVFDYGGCTADQLQRRFFPAPGSRSASYTWIARLRKEGLLVGVRLPSLTGQGSGKLFLTIGPNTRPVIAQRFGLTSSQLRHLKHDYAPIFVAHHLAINDFRLSLELGCEASTTFTLEEWISERELKRSPLRVTDPETETSTPLIADGVFTLALPDGTREHFYLELDMSTLSPKRLRAKLRLYLLQARHSPTSVLFVVPNPARQAAIVQWAKAEAEELDADPKIFWLAQAEQLTEQTILTERIWQVVGGPRLSFADLVSESSAPVSVAPPPFLALAGGMV